MIFQCTNESFIDVNFVLFIEDEKDREYDPYLTRKRLKPFSRNNLQM